MGTRGFKRGVASILLVFALMFSMISVTPLASSGDLIYNPGGTTIEVAQGDAFLIRHTLEFDEPENGAYSITMAWLNYDNDPSENLTFVSATAYYTTGPYAGEYQQANVTLSPSPAGEDMRWTLLVMRPVDNKDPRNGQFNVDITLSASGVGGVPHIPGDHVIPWQFGGIIIVEKYPRSWNRDPITIRVGGRGIEISISPSENSGLPAQTLNYTVTVKNIGGLDDIYDLTISDNTGWGPTLSENLLEVPDNENRTTTLSVTVPANALAGTKDKITVTATSRGNTDVSDNASCIARAVGVDVLISPSYLSRPPGENLEYTVTVKNFGVAADTYTLENRDNAGWSLSLDDASLTVPAGESRTTTLRVTIPDNSIGGTSDNITVIATSTENAEVTDNDSCIAHAEIVRDVEVSIEPSYQENENGGTLTYTVTVANTGNVPDTYTLEKADTMGWSLGLGNTSLEVPESENRTTTLTVAIPVEAIGCTEDTVTVTATSTENAAVSGSDSCIAHVAVLRGVNVDISENYQSDVPGAPLTYTITVTNIGLEDDNYVLTVSDNANWGPTLSDNRLENVRPSENRTLTLSVTIPENAMPSTEDNITVTATSQTDITVSDNASCIAHSKFLEATSYPIDDAEVRQARPDNNFGTNGYMYIGYEENAKRVFLKFKLENIPAGATIESAELSLRVGKVIGDGEKVQVHRVDNDDWDEHTITWSNQPSVGEFLDNRDCSGGYRWYYWDVTSFVASQWENENDRVASFGMVGAGENDPPTHWAELYSKERAEKDRWPFLRVFYRTSANSFSVSISPSYQSALRGRTLNYTVMVKNVGWENSSYNLENRDDAGWAMTLDKVQFENVPPGENRTATLTVTILDNASPGTRDNITVIATLMENENIRGYASCVAHSIVPAVEVSITPNYQSGVPGWPLTYEVMVKNVGLENDSYSLEVIDKGYWDLTLDDNLFENVPPGENRMTTLRVTIPVGPPPSTEDEITVTATSQVDNTVENSASCIAHSGFAAVEVSIAPENQSGLPGATLAYTVTIMNMGNVEDTYDLSVSDNAGWGPTLSENLLMVPAGENRQTTLNVMVPADAPICTRDSVTVTATSQADPIVSASASCTATAEVLAPKTIRVPMDYPTIQEAINAANTGDTVEVAAGTYYEHIMIDGKTNLTLKGSGADLTIIQASHSTNAIRIYESTGTITDFTISGGGDSRYNEGGGIQLIGGDFTINACILTGNAAVNGGAIAVEQGGAIELVNSLIVGNSASNVAGAIEVRPDSTAVLINDTIVNNSAGWSTGGISNSGTTTVTNSIVWANAPGQIYNWDYATIVVTYSDIQGGYTGTNNVSADPLFINAAAGDYHLQAGSPCIDSGTNEGAPTEDIDGNPRPIDGDGDEIAVVDMGTYEYVPPPSPSIGWDASITATFPGGSDDATFSVRPDATSGFDIAYDLPEPPPPVAPPYLRTFFYYPEQTPNELHRSCLGPEILMEWPLRIEYTEGLNDITLTWSVEDVPADYSIFLYRGENLVADMMAEEDYTFQASTGSYDFRIVVWTVRPFTLELTQGWNMISFPVLPENSSPDSIFDGYYVLYRWDAEDKRYVLHADRGSFIEPDPDVEAGVGYWAYVLENENVDLLGVPVNQLTLNLRQGWNLIGSPYGGSSIADLADDPDNSVIPWAFTWNAREKSYNMTQLLEAGKGYWSYALRDCTLGLPDSLLHPPQPPYPAISATSAKYGDNEIRINVSTGSIPAGEWAYSVSVIEGSYSWTTGTSELDPPYVSLGTYASGTYYVSLKHINSGHIYFYDQTITIS